jgi:hypothetical protein
MQHSAYQFKGTYRKIQAGLDDSKLNAQPRETLAYAEAIGALRFRSGLRP